MAVSHFRARALSLILRFPRSLPASHAPPIVPLHRLLSSAAADAASDPAPSVSSPRPFAAEDYLVSRCGLTRAQALKAAKKISHLTSCSKPDAVLAFLGGTLGVPVADVAKLIAICPTFLCADVERTLAPRVADLGDLGLSRDEIVRLISVAPNSIRRRFLRRNLEFWLTELRSFEKILQVLRMSSSLLNIDIDKVAKPNLTFLRQCGLNASEFVGSNLYSARLFAMNPVLLQEAVQRVEELGVERGARIFRYALTNIAFRSKEVVGRRIRWLREFGFSDNDMSLVIRKAPIVLALSEQKIQRNVDFLMKDVGLELSYIARRPALIQYSIEQRLLPRHCFLKVLREKGLLNVELNYYFTASMSEKKFLQKFVLPYKDVVPDIVDGYATKCSGKAMDGVVWPEE